MKKCDIMGTSAIIERRIWCWKGVRERQISIAMDPFAWPKSRSNPLSTNLKH